MSSEFYNRFIRENAGIISKICRAYTDTSEDYYDYFQEVCLQLWRTHESFQHQSAVSTWVYRVALNVCLTQFSKAKKRVATDPILEQHFAMEEASSVEAEQLNSLYAAIKKLKETDRALIILYLEDKSYKEIADILGTNTNHVGVKINRIKNQLKEIIHGRAGYKESVGAGLP